MLAKARANAMTSFTAWRENLAAGLNGESLIPVRWRIKDVDAIYANPLLARTCPQYKTSRFMRWEPRRSVWITTAPCKCWNDLRRSLSINRQTLSPAGRALRKRRNSTSTSNNNTPIINKPKPLALAGSNR